MLKRPTKVPLALPRPSLCRSPWYQEIPNGVLGTWMTNRSKSVFLGRWLARIFMVSTGPCEVIVTWAVAPCRQLALTEAAERTMLNEVLLTAAFAPPAKAEGAGHSCRRHRGDSGDGAEAL